MTKTRKKVCFRARIRKIVKSWGLLTFVLALSKGEN
jgi:hypothetical protein